MPVRHRSILLRSAVLAALVASTGPAARAQEAPAPSPRVAVEPAPEHRRFGIGWRVGNGLGVLGGDVIVAPTPVLALELHAAFLRAELEDSVAGGSKEATGWGVVPSVRVYPLAGAPVLGVHPFVSAGVHHSRWTFRSLSWTWTVPFANAGIEWRFEHGVRLVVGLGFRHLDALEESDGTYTVRSDAGWDGNLELGLRWML